MDFHLTDEQRQLQATVRAFADKECVPLAAEWDRENRVPDHRFEEKIIAMGLYGMTLPERYGGGGRELLATHITCDLSQHRVPDLGDLAEGHRARS